MCVGDSVMNSKEDLFWAEKVGEDFFLYRDNRISVDREMLHFIV